MPVRIQTKDFDAGAEIAALRRDDPKIGAVASFIGVCRDANDGTAVSKMTLEHYPGMTEKALEGIITEAKGRWKIMDALIVHRVGELKPTDQIVLVVVAGVRSLLMARGGVWQTALAQGKALRVAVNQDMAQPTTPVKSGDEVAFFPPVTGG